MTENGRIIADEWWFSTKEQQDWLASRADLIGRCAGLRVHVTAFIGPEPPDEEYRDSWLVTVASDASKGTTTMGTPVPVAQVSRCLRGNVVDIISETLDEYAAEQTWTPEELLVIAAQSGIEVSRG